MTKQLFKAIVEKPSFLGEGAMGRLFGVGEGVEIELEIAEEDIKDADGKVRFKKGEPIVGDNLRLVDGEVSTAAPAGLPLNAKPTGVPGVWMVPVGDTWQVWQPGDPASGLARRSPEEFAATNPDAPTIAETVGALDHDGDGKSGGYVKKAQIAAQLDKMGVEYDPAASRDDLATLLEQEKTKSRV